MNLTLTDHGPGKEYYKSCIWSPDGSCMLANSVNSGIEDLELIFFNPDWLANDSNDANDANDANGLLVNRKFKLSGSCYDICFYPFMNSQDHDSCCFLTSIKDSPVQLWDILTGKLRGTYNAPDHVEVVRAANSLTFNLDGSKIFCGFTNRINVFNTAIPGSKSDKIATTTSKRARDGLKGIISCIKFNPDYSGIFAVGTFSGEIGIYDERDYSLLDLKYLENGISQIEFSRDGKLMITSSRKSKEILVWDLRNTGQVLFRLSRNGVTNQRLKFSLDSTGDLLGTGDVNGDFSVFDLKTSEKVFSKQIHDDVCSSVAFHPFLPFLASTSGQRRQDDLELDKLGQVSVWRID